MTVDLLLGDCLGIMATMEPCSVDAIVTDPPYGLRFMGHSWDRGVPGIPFWEAALRVAKPGTHMLTFGGTRTFHRLACAIEDAGWQIRDTIMWVYGLGFPKSHNLKGDWEGWGTTLKPAWEPILVARKPLCGTVAANVREHGTGGLHIDVCRIGTEKRVPGGKQRSSAPSWLSGHGHGAGFGPRSPEHSGMRKDVGRWPANLIHDGSDEVLALMPNDAARFFYQAKEKRSERWQYLTCNCETVILSAWEKEDRNQVGQTDSTLRRRAISGGTSEGDSSSNTSTSGQKPTGRSRQGTLSITSTETSKTTASKICDSSAPPNTNGCTADANCETGCGGSLAESAEKCSPSMPGTFICRQRDGRCTGVVVNATSPLWSSKNVCAVCGSEVKRTAHPTQKPIELMRYLVRLVTPPGGLILDPFMGSGSTGKAAVLEGFRFVGIDIDRAYIEIARQRIEQAGRQMRLPIVP